jgi:hypothetical protein
LTRAVTIIALTCLLVVGAAAVSILGRDSVPDARVQAASQVNQDPVSNRQAKTDKLAVATFALASFDPVPSQAAATPPDATRADVTRSLRMAYAAQQGPADVVPPQITSPQAVAPAAMPQAPLTVTVPPPAPKVAAKPAAPPPQKPYSLLSDGQIAGIKERLHLTSDQEYYWPGVENALRAVVRRINANHLSNPHAPPGAQIDANSEEVQQLKSAAMPLLFSLREDQKNEVRSLARMIGLEQVAAQI